MLHVNNPFVDVLSQMPMYAKFLKEILPKKRKVDVHETFVLGEEYSVLVLNKLLAKLKNSNSFSIPYLIRNVSIERVLCDLGSSVSLMPNSIIKDLNLEELGSTNTSLQLADCSIKYPLDILEDIPINVDDFYVPIDFAILNMVEDTCTQIILGRPFLAMTGCKIDVKKDRLTFDLGEHHVKFSLFKDFESSHSTLPCCGCDMLVSNSLESLPLESPNDPPIVDCDLFKGQEFDSLNVEPLPLSIVKDKSYSFGEDYLSYCCRFTTLLLSMPPLSGIKRDMDVDLDFDFYKGGSSNGACPKSIHELALRLLYTWTILFESFSC